MTTEQTITDKRNRRGVLRATLRYGVALGATLGGIALFWRNGGRISEAACRDPKGRTGCGPCGRLASCGVPRGLSFKQARKEIENGS